MRNEYGLTTKRLRAIVLIGALAAILWALSYNALSITSDSDVDPISPDPSAAVSLDNDKSGEVAGDTPRTRKIVIDAGHGGIDPGAEGVSGNEEKAFTLFVAAKTAELLSQDPAFEVHMTREDDSFVTLEDRPKVANDLGADAFVSIHGNTYTDPSVSGTESYFFDEDSHILAESVHKRLIEALGFRDRGVKQDNWKVLTQSEVPAILLEVGYLTNAGDEAKLLDDATQTRVAQAIVDGLKDYFADNP